MQGVPFCFEPNVVQGWLNWKQLVPAEDLHSRLVQSWQRSPWSPQAESALPLSQVEPVQQPEQQLPA